MFVLRSILNHELYTDDVDIDGENIHGVAGWLTEKTAKELLETAVKEKVGKYHVVDWSVVEIDDKVYGKINHYLNNDSDYKVFYYDKGYFEILNSNTGRVKRYENDEE